MSGNSSSLYFYRLYLLSFLDYLSAMSFLAFHLLKNFEKMRTIDGFWKTYFRILTENFGEMLEILRTFLRYEIILWICLECFYEIS